MKWLMIMVLGLVMGCNTPGYAFRGIDPVRISIGKSTFDVRVDGTRAQAIRVNTEWAPRLASVAPRMVAAIEAVSGCRVRKLDGDQALGVARLNCGGVMEPLPQSVEYECALEDIHHGYADLVCEPV